MNAAAAPRGHTITAGLLLVSVPTWAYLVWNAPLDRVQGVIQKILFVHPPAAFAMYLGFLLTAIGGALYLWKGDARYDRFAVSSAELGVLFAVVMLVSGPIWGKGTWGKWWSWDLRLTLTLIQFMVYVAYLLLRAFTDGSDRAARFAAVYGIVGVVLIPLNYFAIDMAAGRSIHPENLGQGSLGEGMRAPFWAGVFTALCAFAFLLVRRIEVGRLRAVHEQRQAAAWGAEA